jgi:hypothetical protein
MDLDRLTIDTLLTAAARTGLSRTFLYTSGVWVYGDTAGKLVDESTALTPARLVSWRLRTSATCSRECAARAHAHPPPRLRVRRGAAA